MVDNKIPIQSKIHLYKLEHEVGLKIEKFDLCEEAVDKLWEMGTIEKILAI